MSPWRLFFSLILIVVARPALAPAQEADDPRERQVIDRFASLLEKSPRRGTALDRVYGYHVERGSIDLFLKTYRDRVANDPRDGAAWMVLGLVEAHRGRDAAAVAAFKEAESVRPDDPLPAYYLGQSLVLIGQPDQAAPAFERALTRKPARQDLLEIYQALGRVYQRGHRNDQALAVWNRLEAAFPEDARVQEQIAEILAEEGQLEPALTRYEALAKQGKDPYRQVQRRLQAAELKVRVGRLKDALADFETLLGRLEPESWLAREVRRQVEDVFLRNDDLAGLTVYYQNWIKKSPEDVEALARLGRALAQQGRAAEARPWLEKAVKLAPRRRELRLALIEQLARDKKVAEAEAQYEALSKNEPNHPDVIREWGRLVLHDPARSEAKRKQDAAAVWGRLLAGREKDPVAVAQLADLFRQAELVEPALEQYRKAVTLAPDAPQYREYLGEYLHTLKRKEEALAAWRGMAEGTNRSARTLGRLAEVLSGFGHRAEALGPLTEAVALQPDDFDLRIKQAELLVSLERYDDALKPLDEAARLADSAEGREMVLEHQIRAYQGANTLGAQIAGLKNDLDAGREATSERWRRLARYFEADQKLPEALLAARKAISLEEKSVPAWTALARIEESSGDLLAAADAQRRLAALDRRGRADYLTAIARLEARLGRREAALQAGRDLLAATPGNPESHQFFAELCFQLGSADEGLDALRRAVRANPSDPKGLLTLSDALAQQFRTDEAIELCWRAFERTKELEGKLGIVSKLTELSLRQSQFDKLLARLDRQEQEPGQQRESILCLGQAYQASGDYGTARQTLERLLTPDTRDPQLFGQLSVLSENEGDVATAAKYQRQACELAPSDDGWNRLAQLYLRSGDAGEAETVWSRIADSDTAKPARALEAIDSLLGHGQRETVLALTERLLRADPKNWEALYREGVALAGLDRRDEAMKRFRALLDLRRGDDEESEIVKARERHSSSATTARPAGAPATSASRFVSVPIQTRTASALQIRSIVGLENRIRFGSGFTWTPSDFGQARMASLGWLVSLSQKESKQAEFVKERREAMSQAPRDTRPLWDWYYLELVRGEPREVCQASRELIRLAPSDLSAQWAYLESLSGRALSSSQPGMVVRASSDTIDTTPPLPKEELDQVLALFENLRKRRPEWIRGPVLNGVTAELKRAGREAEISRIDREGIEAISDPLSLYSILHGVAMRGDRDAIFAVLDKDERTRTGRSSLPYGASVAQYARLIGIAMAARAEAKAHGDIVRLLDRFEEFQRRMAPRGNHARASAISQMSASTLRNRVIVALTTQGIRVTQIDFPSPTDAFDIEALSLLRNAYELDRRDDMLSDLIAHYRLRRGEGDNAHRLHATLALGFLLWWNDDRDEATRVLTEAGDLAKNDPEVKLILVELRERRNEPEEALALVDAIEPLDNATMQKRETAAIRLAVALGNVERARVAAERLFGLRLDAETQIQLAAQMHQLGQHELAEAVLARARRRAGNRASALVSLMAQYQRQNQPDLAVQVAHQVLRRGPSPIGSLPQISREDDAARTQALQVLGRSGKLKELIARVEAQLQASPKSVAILQTLADYYRAANDQAKLRATYETIANLRPDDARARLQIGLQLLNAGDAAASLDHFRAAIKKEPALYGQQYAQFENAFRQANQFDELVTLIEGLDLASTGNYYSFSTIAQNLMADPKTRERGLKLFRKTWDAFPAYRTYLFQNLHNTQVWQLPEMYDFVRQAVVPDPDQTQVDPWAGMVVTSYQNDGRVSSLLANLLEIASRQGKTADLTREIEAALKRLPDWIGGKVMLAILQLRAGNSDRAVPALEAIVKDKTHAIPSDAQWSIAQELEDFAPASKLAETLYIGAMEGDMRSSRGFTYPIHPSRRLVQMYQRDGRVADARALILRMSKQRSNVNYADPHMNVVQHANRLGSLGDELLNLDDPADAVRLFGEMMANIDSLPEEDRYHSYRQTFNDLYRQGIDRALKGLGPEALASAVGSLLKPRPDAGGGEPALDLILLVEPRELDRATVTSLLALTLQSAVKTPEVRAEVRASLGRLLEEFPGDLSVHIASTLLALAEGKAEAIDQAIARLAKLVERTPLDDLPAGTRANARQRNEAARQLGLWLAARGCWSRESVRASGDRFARRALDAARRQTENRWALAMLREWGQAELDRGDRAAAEAHWSQMLDLVLANMSPSRTGSPAGPKPAPAPTPVPPPPAAPPRRATPVRMPIMKKSQAVPAITLEHFEQAGQVAKLAAEHGMHALALRALRESLRGGPPVSGTRIGQNIGVRTVPALLVSGLLPRDGTSDPIPMSVESIVSELDRLWQEKHAPERAVYEALRDVVLPPSRPAEIFLYAGPLSTGSLTEPGSVGAILCRRAVRADQSEDLTRRIEARRSQPLGELAATVLLAQLGLARNDEALTGRMLEALGDRLRKDTLQTSAELACLAALPALKVASLSNAAEPVLDLALKSLETRPTEEPLGTMIRLLARRQFERGHAAEGRKRLDAYLAAMDRTMAGYQGDYAIHRRRHHLRIVAFEYARAGLWPALMETMGRVADSVTVTNDPDQSNGPVMAALAMHLGTLPAAERYETLRAWTMPTANRRSVRLLSAFLPAERPPAIFAAPAGRRDFTLPPSCTTGLASTPLLLIEAARESGRLDALADSLKPLAERKVENAETLALLAEIARGRGSAVEPRLRTVLESIRTREAKPSVPGTPPETIAWNEYLLGRACLFDDDLSPLGQAMAKDLGALAKKVYDYGDLFLTHLRRDQAARPGGTDRAGRDPGLALWHPASHAPAALDRTGAVPAVWVESEGHLAHLAGPQDEFMFLDLPLAGSFEFTVEAYHGDGDDGAIGFGGLVCEQGSRAPGRVWAAGGHTGHQYEHRGMAPWPFPKLRENDFNRLTVAVEPGTVRFLMNGHLFHEETDPSPTSPWLALYAGRERRTFFRNPTIKGSPEVPRQVRLTHADRLDGWGAMFYGESKAPAETEDAPPFRPVSARGNAAPRRPEEYDWHARDGVIIGRRSDPSASRGVAVQSRLFYQRPLRAGETLSYEFFHEPDLAMVHPALGWLVFLLEPSGVRLHWMTDGTDLDWTGLKTDNAVDEPSTRRAPLTLKPGEWNAIVLRVGKDSVAIDLNGTTVFERPIEPGNDRLFSLFHFKDQTEAKVRNVVLRGDWPERLAAGDLFRRSVEPDRDERRARREIVGEAILTRNTDQVLREARALPPAERFEQLARWVLPGSEHDGFRLQGDFTPTNPAPPVAPNQTFAPGARRVLTGGALEAPALDLVAVARDLGRLDDLADRVAKAEPRSDLDRRGRLALEALIRIEQDRDDEAEKALRQLDPLLARLAPDDPEWMRWPELVAATRAMDRAKCRPAATALLDLMIGAPIEKKTISERWDLHARHARALGRVLALPDKERRPFGSDPALTFWSPVARDRAATRGAGDPLPHWSAREGAVEHDSGHAGNALYFNVPLRGEFEVNAELASFHTRETRIEYGGMTSLVRPRQSPRNGGPSFIPLPEKVVRWSPYRLVVRAGTRTAYVNGKPTDERSLPDNADPWLALTISAPFHGGVRKLAITGNPVVPEVLVLSSLPDLTGWRADVYDESLAGPRPSWEKRGDEIFGRRLRDVADEAQSAGNASLSVRSLAPTAHKPASTRQESVLQYHRPMLEDGVIEYEFFYESDRVRAHPALDRLAFLIEPDGVAIHWMTDARYDRAGLLPDNRTVEPSHRRGPSTLPLKAAAWNTMKVRLAGDTITLTLNGEKDYEGPLEPTNQRTFGLFRYADETEARVRNVTYRGQWPKQLPAAGDLLSVHSSP